MGGHLLFEVDWLTGLGIIENFSEFLTGVKFFLILRLPHVYLFAKSIILGLPHFRGVDTLEIRKRGVDSWKGDFY